MHESLAKATHDIEFLRDDLLNLLAVASPIEALLILPMLEQVGIVANNLKAFHLAALCNQAK